MKIVEHFRIVLPYGGSEEEANKSLTWFKNKGFDCHVEKIITYDP